MPHTIEAKAYGPDSSEEELAALRDRVTLIESDIVLFREVPVQSTFHLDVFWGKIGELTAQLPRFFVALDLSEARRPSPEVRAHIKHLIMTRRQAAFTAVFTEANFLLNVVARFVLASAGMKDFSVHRNRADALAAIARAREAAPRSSDDV